MNYVNLPQSDSESSKEKELDLNKLIQVDGNFWSEALIIKMANKIEECLKNFK